MVTRGMTQTRQLEILVGDVEMISRADFVNLGTIHLSTSG